MSHLKLVDPSPELRAHNKCPEFPLIVDATLTVVSAQDHSLLYNFPLTFSALEMEAIRRTL